MTENNTKRSEWSERERGALWIKKGVSKDYMSGHFSGKGERVNVVLFKNNNKTSERSPDYIIYESKPREDVAATTGGQETAVSEQENVETATVMHSDKSEEVPELLA